MGYIDEGNPLPKSTLNKSNAIIEDNLPAQKKI